MSGKKQNGKQGKSASPANGAAESGAAEVNATHVPRTEPRPEWKPNVEFFTSLSADGRFVICKTVITAIKPVRYFEKVMAGKNASVDRAIVPTESSSTEKAG